MLVICVSCNDTQTSNVPGDVLSNSRTKTIDTTTGDTIRNSERHVDTVYTTLYFEDSLKYYGHFGMTTSEWNKKLAILARDGIITDLKEDSIADRYSYGSKENSCKDNLSWRWLHNGETVYKGYKAFDKYSGYSIEGIFRFPETYGSYEVFIREGKRIDEGVLIGIVLSFRIRDEDINTIASTLINNDNLTYLAGDKIPAINIREPIVPKYQGYRIGDEYSNAGMDHAFDELKDEKTAIEHEHKYNSTAKYMPLYEGRLFYSIIEFSKYSSATFNCQFQYNKKKGCVVVSIDNPMRDYCLTQIILSKKQSGIKVEDYLSGTQRNNITQAKSKKDLIEKALNK